VKTPVPQVLAIWEWIQPVSAVMDKIATIRNGGIYCYLATNQQSYRADYMRATFHYNTLFDGAFYSYEVGTAKPDKLYFQSVLSQLSIPSSEILFIDDKAANIAAARTCGMQASLFDAQATERPGAVLSTVLRTFDIP
jgi:putative hydrolase of the HAD superfamily